MYAQTIISDIFISHFRGGYIFASCNPRNGIFQPTLTPTFTFTASPTICPEVVIATPAQSTLKPYLIISLFEDNPENRDLTLQDLELLNGVLAKYAEPGDYLIMLKMEPPTLEQATFVRQKVGTVNSTPYPPIPTPLLTFTPYPTSATTPSTTIGKTAVARDITATAQSLYATATYEGFLHNCALQKWTDDYSQIHNGQEAELAAKRTEFTQKITNDVNKGLDDEPVPGVAAIWSGLIYASALANNECTTAYARCILLIFSDMIEEFKPPAATSTINLQNVEVLVVMRNCPYLYSGTCGDWKSTWEQYLNGKTKEPATFINENTSEVLKGILRR